MSKPLFHINDAKQYIGKELATTEWVTVTQDMVNEFAHSTKDPDWMHIDIQRSQKESPYGTTIVQGFLMMSLVLHLCHIGNVVPDGTSYGLNYGMDRVRFTDVVLVGSRVRSRISLLDVTPKEDGRYLFKTQHYLEVEGKDKPAMVAEHLAMWFTKMTPKMSS